MVSQMGLLFALQPQPDKSTVKCLRLRSHFRKFAMGGSFLFFALFMGVMTLAAAPLFKLMRQEGGFWDQIIVFFFIGVLILYPLLAFLCFTFEEHVIFTRRADNFYDLKLYKTLALMRWGEKNVRGFLLSDLKTENWIGQINAAALNSSRTQTRNRYATKGHWLLMLKSPEHPETNVRIERRARKEEIEWLRYLIEDHFNESPIDAPTLDQAP